MKKIFLFLGLFLLLIPFKVNASLTLNTYQISSSSLAMFYYQNNNMVHCPGQNTSKSGLTFANCSSAIYGSSTMYYSIETLMPLVKDQYYSMSFIFSKFDPDDYINVGDFNEVSLGNDKRDTSIKADVSYFSTTWDGAGYIISANSYNMEQPISTNAQKVDIVFKATANASFINIPLKLNLKTGVIPFYIGIYFMSVGSSSENVTLQLDEMNQKIEDSTISINNNIDSMKEKQDETNNLIGGESENTEDSKCGVICKLKGIFTGIIELPGKLVSLLIDGLKSLFVPTDEQLYEIINDSKDLAENFGFVGESVDFFLTIFTSLLGMVNANGCIELPEFTIGATSLTPSITFWHAQNVCLNDNLILSSNITTIRTITSIALVALFVNFATRKFFSILNKNDNDSNSISYDPRTGEVKE